MNGLNENHKQAEKFTEPKEIGNEDVASEGGWGWIVVIAVSYCFGILYGLVNNYALIYNEFTMVYNETESHIIYAAWTGSISYGLQCIFCIIGSILVDLFNPRLIGVAGGLISAISMVLSAWVNEIKYYLLTYGLLLSIGQALLLASTLSILPHYFDKKLSLANGITNSCAAICCSVLPMLTSYILQKYNLEQAFYLLALLNVVASFMCCSYRPVYKASKSKISSRIKESFGFDVLKEKKFLIWCAATFVAILGYLIPIVIIDHHSEKAFPGYSPVYLNIAFGIASGFGALFFGIIGDFTKFNRVHYHTAAYFFYGIIQVSIPFASNFYVLVVMMTILGLMDGVLLCFIVPITCDLVKSTKLSNQAAGYYHLICAPMAVAGPALAGFFYEIFHNYHISFYIGGASCLIGSFILIVLILIPDIIRKSRTNSARKQDGTPVPLLIIKS